MPNNQMTPGITAGRLPAELYRKNFSDLHSPYEPHEAAVEADRCYFCHDAPCVTACPTEIDIPMFIRQIQSGRPQEAARTILSQNILGGMCARVCPTETLCEEVCVRETAEGKPVEIGRLQRFATDALMESGEHPFVRAPATGRKVAVVGAGPAGLACAHRLAMYGHDVDLFDARAKAGGLNEFGIAAYKVVNRFAAREIEWLMKIGGIALHTGKALGGGGLSLASLQSGYDAVFLGIGLSGVTALRAEGEEREGVAPAVDFIADLRQAEDLSSIPVGRDVVVIGGGMTAVDAALQSRLLGSENVTIAYRRGRGRMSASGFEQDLAASRGVRIVTNVRPLRSVGDGVAREVEFEYTEEMNGRLEGTGETFRLPADQVLKAIGQSLGNTPDGLTLESGKIAVTGAGRTGLDGVWAGGDCALGGDDLTVTAVAEGRDAAEDMHASIVAPNG